METIQKEHLKEMLDSLPDEKIIEVRDFIAFLLEKEKRRKAFVEETLKAEQEPTIVFESVDKAVNAILNETKDRIS